jgi:Rtr1/RPAP2 family
LENNAKPMELEYVKEIFNKSDYKDIVTERSIAGNCGNPTCLNPLPKLLTNKKNAKYSISLRLKKVYDNQVAYFTALNSICTYLL